MEEPSRLSTSLCLLHAVFDKSAWLRERGIKEPWPVAGLRDIVHVDSGADFRSRAFKRRGAWGALQPQGRTALCLGLGIMTAIKEISQGRAYRLDPCVLRSYDIDSEGIADLTEGEGGVGGIRFHGGYGLRPGDDARGEPAPDLMVDL